MNRTVSGSSSYLYKHDVLFAVTFIVCWNLLCSADRAHESAWRSKDASPIGLCLLFLRGALTVDARRSMDNVRYVEIESVDYQRRANHVF
jgi:hypothetical protein